MADSAVKPVRRLVYVFSLHLPLKETRFKSRLYSIYGLDGNVGTKNGLITFARVGLPCLVKDEDGVYHRVEVLCKLTEKLAAVYYLDFGNIAIKHITRLFKIKEAWKRVPRFCFSFIVRNMQNKYASWQGNKVINDLYKYLLDDTKLHVLKIEERSAKEIYVGEIYEKDEKTLAYEKFMKLHDSEN